MSSILKFSIVVYFKFTLKLILDYYYNKEKYFGIHFSYSNKVNKLELNIQCSNCWHLAQKSIKSLVCSTV